jgi:hypothetical protein
MPSSGVQTFTDADDYAAAIRGAQAELTVLGRGQFRAKITKIDLHRLWMQRFSDNLPRIAHSAGSSIMNGRAVVAFRTAPGPPLMWNGSEMPPTDIVREGQAENIFQRSSGLFSMGCMSLPAEEMTLLGTTIAGCDLTPPKQTLTVTPPPPAMAKLQRLHAEAGQLAEDTPKS